MNNLITKLDTRSDSVSDLFNKNESDDSIITIKGLFISPGLGKTQRAIEIAIKKALNNERVIYIGPTHLMLDEFKERLHSIDPTIEIRHIRGFLGFCRIQYKRWLYEEKGIPAQILCTSCKKAKSCPYQAQFKTPYPNVIIMPEHFLSSSVPTRFNGKYLIWDEASPFKDFSVPVFTSENRIILVELRNYILGLGDFDTKIGYKKRASKLLDQYRKDPETRNKIIDWIHLKEKQNRYFTYFRFRQPIDDVILVPLAYKMFEIAESGIEVLLLAAESNRDYWEHLEINYHWNRDREEINFEYDFKTEPARNENSLIVRMDYISKNSGKNSRWYSSNEQSIFIEKAINELSSFFPSNKKGMIIHKKWERWAKQFKIPFLHYGATESRNDLRDCEILFCVGTFKVDPSELRRQYFKFYNEEPDMTASNERDRWLYKDANLERLNDTISEIQMYQALHRCRLLPYNRLIFFFGSYPKKIESEINYMGSGDYTKFINYLKLNLGAASIDWGSLMGMKEFKKDELTKWLSVKYHFPRALSRKLINQAIEENFLNIRVDTATNSKRKKTQLISYSGRKKQDILREMLISRTIKENSTKS
ncbi:MAG: hypothetical protein ACFE9L_03075 [Candidatus Hodarchaeota archaeon]